MLWSIFSYTQTLEKIAENSVSTTTKVFTYKIVGSSNSNNQDNQSTVVLNSSQQDIITYFLSINGVEDANFDKATNTFTVVAKHATQIPSTLTFE
jgi:hypothetical protein